MNVTDDKIIEVWDRVQGLKKYSIAQALRVTAEALGISIERVARTVGVEE